MVRIGFWIRVHPQRCGCHGLLLVGIDLSFDGVFKILVKFNLRLWLLPFVLPILAHYRLVALDIDVFFSDL